MRHSTTAVSLFALFAIACTPAATDQDLETRIQVANDELLNKGNVDMAAEFFAPTYVFHTPAQELHGGPETIRGFVTELRTAFPDLRVEVEVLVAEGDRVAWQRTHRGTHQGDFMGVPASGRSILWRAIVVTRFEAGKIAEEWGVSDLGERLLALKLGN
jgi:steroid delta-isomerase-like uncharacterized protein